MSWEKRGHLVILCGNHCARVKQIFCLLPHKIWMDSLLMFFNLDIFFSVIRMTLPIGLPAFLYGSVCLFITWQVQYQMKVWQIGYWSYSFIAPTITTNEVLFSKGSLRIQQPVKSWFACFAQECVNQANSAGQTQLGIHRIIERQAKNMHIQSSLTEKHLCDLKKKESHFYQRSCRMCCNKLLWFAAKHCHLVVLETFIIIF